jgi:hypothetical protein
MAGLSSSSCLPVEPDTRPLSGRVSSCTATGAPRSPLRASGVEDDSQSFSPFLPRNDGPEIAKVRHGVGGVVSDGTHIVVGLVTVKVSDPKSSVIGTSRLVNRDCSGLVVASLIA